MISTTVARWLLNATEPPVICATQVEIDEALARRNIERLASAKQALGRQYLLHPSNQIRRVREARPRGATLTAVTSESLAA